MAENGGNHSGIDSDTSQNGDDKLCRDFVRNVCNRGKNCKFIHPENAKIRTEPIFCHDYQQNKCFRSTCKFIHCTREDEEHYKQTGELPEGASGTEYYESKPRRPGGKGVPANIGRKPARVNQAARGGGRSSRGNTNGKNDSEIPICKDHLKGVCDRPPGGCKFRHINPVENYAGGQNRRRGGSQSYYESGPESKRNHYSTDYDDYGNTETYTPPPPPPPPQSLYSNPYSVYHDTGSHSVQSGGGNLATGNSPHSLYSGSTGHANRNGYVTQAGATQLDMSNAITSFSNPLTSNSTVAAMKALEDENFMLKRRIEELKKQVNDLVATNEYLLSQNAHLRINNINITKEVQVQGVSAGGATGSVVQTLVSMAQPIGINSSLTGTPTQPLSTITSLPTVSITPVSMSQPLPVVSMPQHSQAQSVYPLVTTQGVLPPPN